MNLLESIENSALGVWIRESEWGYPIVLICHTLGMACVVGVVTAYAIRIATANTATAPDWFETSFRIAWLGFVANLISGLVLFTGSPQRYLSNPAFQAKLVALALGAVALRWLSRRLSRQTDTPPDLGTRWTAVGTLLVWFGAIAAGRLIAYIR